MAPAARCQAMGGLVRKVHRGVTEPYLVVRRLHELYYRWHDPTGPSIDPFEEDWDTLLILDACRYDAFEDRHDLPGELERRTIASSSTLEFLEQYVDGTDLRDTVYVTANPQLSRHLDRFDVSFHDIIDLWETGWDESISSVHPETVVDAAVAAHEQYPHKRLVIHFIQPHHPYIGPTGRTELQIDSIGHFWNRVHTGDVEVGEREIRQAYEENLDIVLDSVETLLAEIKGRTVVTADHGEMLGDRGGPIPITEYGHPTGHRTPELVTVPWLVYERGPRPEITPGRPVSTDRPPNDRIENRLQALGYR